MVSGRSNLVEVSLEYRRDNAAGTAAAFFQGDMEEDSRGCFREVWIWLPRAAIETEDNGDGTMTVTLPEKMAIDKGLV